MNFVSHDRRRGVGAHPAGIRTRVAITHTLVVLAGGHRQNVLAVDHHDKAGFFTVEELFNHDTVARIAESVTCQHVLNRGFGFFERHRDDHAFTGGQTVGLDNNRRALLT